MAETVYDFKKQLAKGKDGEALLDEYFRQWYDITEASREEERRGIDRKFYSPKTGLTTTVEYKTDSRTAKTGNVFVETYSKMETNKPGWGWSCGADLLVYFALPDTLYMISPSLVQEHIPEWLGKYGQRTVKNRGWTSAGIPVPTREFAKICEVVLLP